MTDFELSEQLTLSTKCLGRQRGLMRLNRCLYDYVFWGDHFSFMNLWEQMTPGVVVANLNPRGIVGRVYIVNRYVLINTYYRSCRLHGLRRFFYKSYSPLYSKSMEA